MGLLSDINALLITAKDSGPDALATGKDIFAIIASAGLNQQLDQQGAADLTKLVADLNQSSADIIKDGGPQKFADFLTQVAGVLGYVSTNGPEVFQAFQNLWAVFSTQGTSAGVNALGAGGIQAFITAIDNLLALQKKAAAVAPTPATPATA